MINAHSTRFNKLLACILSVVMVCTIMFSIAPTNAMADSTYGDFTYVVLSDGTIEITDYTGSGVNVSIPSSIANKPVRVIGTSAFFYCESLESITIPNGVTSIGESAFENCKSLISITIPNSVTSIDKYAFYGCESLESITIPDGVTSISGKMFTDCTSLENITIPDSVTLIEEYAFYCCESLKSITIPDSVTAIYMSAFEGCTSLQSIVLPDNVTKIENHAFAGCTSLESITIPESVTVFGGSSWSSMIRPAPESVFAGCDNLTINCYENTCAHQYAMDYGFDCILMPRPSTSTPTPTPIQGNSTIPPATGNTVNRQEAQNFATRCYELVLDRTPDATGLNNWTNSLVNNQNTGAHMAYGFFFSQEYINSNTSNEEFVTTLYNVFLDRAPDQGGLNDWVGQLEAGASREQVFAGVSNSREFFGLCNGYGITAGHYVQGLDNTQQQNVNAFVARLYSMCLGRNGDYAGQESWVRQLINRQNSGAGVAYGFFFSQEFINRNLTNEEYVATLYRVFLGREPDQAGFNSWVSQLNNGADRLSIFRGFAHSQEYTNICNSYGIDRGSV